MRICQNLKTMLILRDDDSRKDQEGENVNP